MGFLQRDSPREFWELALRMDYSEKAFKALCERVQRGSVQMWRSLEKVSSSRWVTVRQQVCVMRFVPRKE